MAPRATRRPAALVLLSLLPGVFLAACVGSGAEEDDASGRLTLAFMTDAQEEGWRPKLSAAVEVAREKGAEHLLYGGDTSYGYDPPKWDWSNALAEYADPERLFAVLGNHDEPREPFDGDATWWARTLGDILIVGLDTNRNLTEGSRQLAWLEETLENRGGKPTILLMHIAWWIPNEHHRGLLEFPGDAAHLDDLVEEHGVGLVLAGHEHYYAREERGDSTFLVGSAVEAGARAVPQEVARRAEASFNDSSLVIFELDGSRVRARTFTPEGELLDAFSLDLEIEKESILEKVGPLWAPASAAFLVGAIAGGASAWYFRGKKRS